MKLQQLALGMVLMSALVMDSAFAAKVASVSISNSPLDVEEILIESVLIDYANALMNGNTDAIKETLGRDLLDEKARLLNNPFYTAALKERYANAKFKVLDFNRIDENLVEVPITIELDEQEKIEVILVFAKEGASGYRIVEERDPE
jgi:hypothetical protein